MRRLVLLLPLACGAPPPTSTDFEGTETAGETGGGGEPGAPTIVDCEAPGPSLTLLDSFVLPAPPELEGQSAHFSGFVASDDGGFLVQLWSNGHGLGNEADIVAISRYQRDGTLTWTWSHKAIDGGAFLLSLTRATDGTLLTGGSVYDAEGESWNLAEISADGQLIRTTGGLDSETHPPLAIAAESFDRKFISRRGWVEEYDDGIGTRTGMPAEERLVLTDDALVSVGTGAKVSYGSRDGALLWTIDEGPGLWDHTGVDSFRALDVDSSGLIAAGGSRAYLASNPTETAIWCRYLPDGTRRHCVEPSDAPFSGVNAMQTTLDDQLIVGVRPGTDGPEHNLIAYDANGCVVSAANVAGGVSELIRLSDGTIATAAGTDEISVSIFAP